MSSPPAIPPAYGSLTPPLPAEKDALAGAAQYPAYVPIAPLEAGFPAPNERRRCRRRRVFSRILRMVLFTAFLVWMWPAFRHNIAHLSRKVRPVPYIERMFGVFESSSQVFIPVWSLL